MFVEFGVRKAQIYGCSKHAWLATECPRDVITSLIPPWEKGANVSALGGAASQAGFHPGPG